MDEDTDGDGTKDNKDPLPNSYGISNRLNISEKNQLLSEIDSQIRSDVEWHKWLAQLPYNGVSECIDIIYDYDEIITDLSNAYMIPKPAIQSVLLRELKCLWAQDDFADSAVLSYYLYKHQLEDYHNWSKLEQLLLGPPEPHC